MHLLAPPPFPTPWRYAAQEVRARRAPVATTHGAPAEARTPGIAAGVTSRNTTRTAQRADGDYYYYYYYYY